MAKNQKPARPKTKVATRRRTREQLAESAPQSRLKRPSREEAEDAVRTLIRWAGDDPTREGMSGTPARVARAYEEWFAGYDQDPQEYLSRTFQEVGGYDEIVALKDIPFRVPLRTSPGANYRSRAHWLLAERSCRRNIQNGKTDRRLCEAVPSTGEDDR